MSVHEGGRGQRSHLWAAVVLACSVGLAVLGAAQVPAPTASAAPSAPTAPSCAPLDVVFLLDSSTSMSPAIANVKQQSAQLVDKVVEASGGNYRIGLIDFADDVQVRVPFAAGNADAVKSQIPELFQDRGNTGDPEAWDEALVTAVDGRKGVAAPNGEDNGVQIGDFDASWRPEAQKIIVLVSDARHGGFEGVYDDETADQPQVRAGEVATRAKGKGIRIATVFVPNGNDQPEAAGDLRSVSDITGAPTFRTKSDGSNLAEGLDLAVAACAADSDGDGLFDEWERTGVTFDDGVRLDLPALGANPDRKDLFVQFNWMGPGPETGCIFGVMCTGGGDASHRPDPRVLERLVTMYADAPVPNPDGSTGITLHVDVGDLTGADGPITDSIDGADAKGGEISTHERLLDPTTTDDFNRFYEMKNAAMPPERARAFTWVLYGHRIAGPGLLGLAMSTPGDALIVAHDRLRGDLLKESATVAHELGHTLGLRHGGYDSTHFKPNYLSLMNYDYALTGGLVRDMVPGILDFSRWDLAPLDPSAGLDENVGVKATKAPEPTGYQIDYRCAGADRSEDNPPKLGKYGPIDWNCDDDTTDTGVTGGVHESSSSTLLLGRNDWATISFSGGVRGALASDGEDPEEDGFTDEAWQAAERPYGIEMSTPGPFTTPAGSDLVRIPLTVTSTGTDSATYTATVSTTGDWEPSPTVDGEVQIDPGETVLVYADIKIPDTAEAGDTVAVRVELVGAGQAVNFGAATTVDVEVGAADEVAAEGSLTLKPANATAGSKVRAAGSGFRPGEAVVVSSPDGVVDAVDTEADSSGNISVELTASDRVGSGTVVAVGSPEPAPVNAAAGEDDNSANTTSTLKGNADTPYVLDAELTVSAPKAEPPGETDDGGSVPWLLIAASAAAVILAIVIVVASVVVARRRRGAVS